MTINSTCGWFKKDSGLITLKIYVQPGAKRTEIAGLFGKELKIRLLSPPLDGRANEALLKFIAMLFQVPLRQVRLKQGDKSRHKVILVVESKIDPITIYKIS